jgi:prepilin-type N-terminal cleavage/methylation domain-containing protein
MKAHGFSLIEVLVAIGILMTGAASLAQLFAVSSRTNFVANATSTTLLLAQEKMESLLAEADLPPSPSDALRQNRPGFFERLDHGFICRWSIDPLPSSPLNAVVVQVVVFRGADRGVQTRLVAIRPQAGGR